jgi:hypothetical protein
VSNRYALRRELEGWTLIDRETGRRIGAIWESRRLARLIRGWLNTRAGE